MQSSAVSEHRLRTAIDRPAASIDDAPDKAVAYTQGSRGPHEFHRRTAPDTFEATKRHDQGLVVPKTNDFPFYAIPRLPLDAHQCAHRRREACNRRRKSGGLYNAPGQSG